MPVLQIIYAPNPIFKKKCEVVTLVDESIHQIANDMLQTMSFEQAIGLGANMVGVTKQIAVIDLVEGGISKPYIFINPEIYWKSEEKQSFDEASLSFPGISAKIERAKSIKVKYLDIEGNPQDLTAEGLFASVIQHEVDYLNGVVFVDHLSKMKRDILLKKMDKYLKMHPPHVHGAHCHH